MLVEQTVIPILHLHVRWNNIGVWDLGKKFQHDCTIYNVMMWTFDFSHK